MPSVSYESENYVCPSCNSVYTKIIWEHNNYSWNYALKLGLPQCIKCDVLLLFVPEDEDSNVKPIRVIRTGNMWVSPGGQADEGRVISYERSDMNCPFCGWSKNIVVDSRIRENTNMRHRRRECTKCGRRFGTHETYDSRTIKEVEEMQEERRKNAGV
jgi:transposase-like protein